ncbi:MAG: chalcone isomerase family protein [Piscinibacter sp.]|nr:chalcone isomerase family protein [Piscinibacter sp.]
MLSPLPTTMHPTPGPWTRRAVLAAALAAAAPLRAATIAEQRFEDRIRLAGAELVLNGVGLRAVAWFKGYAAGLYLAQKATTPAGVLAQAGPKRVQMKMMVEVESVEFVKAVDKGMRRNHSAAELGALQARIAQFDALVRGLGTLKKGDVVDLDWLPGHGLQLSLNTRPRGEPVVGDDFYAGILKIFIGNDPVDKRLKAGLLGGSPSY